MVETMQQPHSRTQDHEILVEQITLLYRVGKPVLGVNLVISSALAALLWDVVSTTTIVTWMALMVLVIFARGLLHMNYQRHFKPELAQRYGLLFIIGTGSTALVWGIGSVLLFPADDVEHQLLILFMLVGMGAGSVATLSNYLPAFYTYFLVSMIPITIKFYQFGDSLHFSLAVMTTAYIIALSYFARIFSRSLITSLKLRFENIDLVKQLRAQKNEADRANMAKSKFLAAASHDLRQPLHALTLFTSVLDESIKYPKVRRVVDQIKTSVDALQSLFNALLDISQLDAGVTKVEKTDFYLQPVFEKLANDFNSPASEKDLSIFWSTCAYAAHTDQTLLEQILRNYLSNAIRYTEKGEVRITCEAKGESVVIQVIDTGIGIAEEDQQAIFEEFHQLSNPERDRSKGLGLGLAIVQRTAKLLGHAIEIESVPGIGSTFSITLEQAVITEQADVADSQVESDIVPLNRVLLIVIDDELSIREGTRSLLELWACDVITATDQEEAVEKLRQQNRAPDGIIVDYRLRENRTGIEAINAIHAEYDINILALIMTGDIAVDRLREVNSSGFQVLHKPIAPAKMRAFLRKVQLRNKGNIID